MLEEYNITNEMQAQLNKYCEQEYKKIVAAGRNPLEFELAYLNSDMLSMENKLALKQTYFIRERDVYCEGCELYYTFFVKDNMRECRACGTLSDL